jgi:PhzF family phenazine biosynthesis protein
VRRLPLYRVDAFADAVFRGNPAAVCPLPAWEPDALLQAIAAENNLSETAFLVWPADPVPLRWFTPRQEVPLCGHATLASGLVVLACLAPERDSVTFATRSGALVVRREAGTFAMDFPALAVEPVGRVPAALREGLGVDADQVLVTREDPNYFVLLEDEGAVAALHPDPRALERLHPFGVAVSAPGRSADFVSRYFAPSYGIPEDPVTGSIHCALGPCWAERLGRGSLTARQLSSRGGDLALEVRGDRVELRGKAVCYLEGEVLLP